MPIVTETLYYLGTEGRPAFKSVAKSVAEGILEVPKEHEPHRQLGCRTNSIKNALMPRGTDASRWFVCCVIHIEKGD